MVDRIYNTDCVYYVSNKDDWIRPNQRKRYISIINQLKTGAIEIGKTKEKTFDIKLIEEKKIHKQ